MYLNLAAYGNQFVGAERASRGYFGVPASMVTPAQAAFLAGLPQRPSGFNPYRSRDAALRRQRVVLRRMAADGALTAQSGRTRRGTSGCRSLAARVADSLRRTSSRWCSRPPANRARARIETTLDAALQADVDRHHQQPSRAAARARRAQRRRRRARQRHAASGSRGKDRATTSTRRAAARSTAR